MYGIDENAWTPVILKKQKTPINTYKPSVEKPKEKEFDEKTDDKVTIAFRKEFQKRRLNCKKTQQQLANEAKNLKDGVKRINELENGKISMKEAIQIAITVRHVIGHIDKNIKSSE